MENIKKPTIFIIDDEKIHCELLKDSLGKYGYRIITFNDSLEGYEFLTQNDKEECECLILDLIMPKMNGFQFIEKLKKEYPKSYIPIIISSANQDIESIKNALDLGAYDYFTKPLSEDDLNIMLPKKIKNAVQFKRMQKDLIEKNEKITRDLNIASQFLIKMFAEISNENYNLFYKYLPYNEIGGDFIDFVENEDGFILFMVDISGHGVAAALVASFLKAEFRRFFTQNKDILMFLNYLNNELISLFHDSFFCTVFIASYNKYTRKLSYINAGHPPPILCINEKPIFLKSTGPLVGIIEIAHFIRNEISIGKNCLLICYTDGMYEFWLEETNQIFGFKKFYNLLCKIYFSLKSKSNFTIKKFIETVFKTLKFYSNDKYSDDLLMFMIQL